MLSDRKRSHSDNTPNSRILQKRSHQKRDTPTDRKDILSQSDLEHFRTIVLSMREEALSILRDCQESVQSIESNEPSYGPREQSVSFMERSADASMREDYALLIDRQARLLGYCDAALKRIDEGRYGTCKSCNELIARERLEAVPHSQLCITCKGGGKPDLRPTSAQPWAAGGKRR
jgi:DnaK suppressor protein